MVQHLGLTLAWVGVAVWPPSATAAFCASFAVAAAVAAAVGVRMGAVPDVHADEPPLLVSTY